MARLYALQKADMRAMEKQGVRENPIRRGGYSGGAAPTQPVRFELASERAEEIEQNRTNPRRSGATPTMGVSRVRGGKHTDAHYEHDREGKLLHETMEAHEAEGRAMKRGGKKMRGGMGLAGLRRYIHPILALLTAGGFGSLAGQAAYYADPSHPSIPSAIAAGLFTALGTIGTYAEIVRRLQHQGVPDAPAAEIAEAAQAAQAAPDHAAVEMVENPARQGRGGKMCGGRAVPSAGLSQFRGGSNGRMVGAGKGSDSDSSSYDSESSEEYEGGARGPEILAREKAERPAIRAGLSAQHSAEAKEMGQHLGKHLIAVRGGGFFDLFTKGIVEAGQEGQSVAQQTGEPSANAPPPPSGVMTTTTPPAEAKGGALFHRKKDMVGEMKEAHEEHTGRRFGRTRKGAGSKIEDLVKKAINQRREDSAVKPAVIRNEFPLKKLKTGLGSFADERKAKAKAIRDKQATHPEANAKNLAFSNEYRTKHGGFLSGQYEGMGGRSTRAAIVKKVMAEKGMKLIEASKYVKAHGLYKGGVRSITQEAHGRRASPPMSAEMEAAEEAKKDEGAVKGLMKLSRQRDFPEEVLHRPVARRRETHPAPAQSQLSLTGEPIGRGGKKRRAPAGPSDGRRKRAEIVKKVMAEKGMKMIEASKYVKTHGLY